MKLQPMEELMNEKELFFSWLLSGRINFKDLSDAYVDYLETLKRHNRVLIQGLTIPLSQYFYSSKFKPKKQEIFIRCKSAFNLIKSKMFLGTPFEKELKDLIEKYQYTEDENGCHTMPTLPIKSKLKVLKENK